MVETDISEYRMYCVVRQDIEIPTGKLIPQVGHAYLMSLRDCRKANPLLAEAYDNDEGQAKIGLRAKNLQAMERGHRELREAGIPCCLVTDEGRTVFPEPTVTVLGIGPCRRDDLPAFVRRFQLYGP